MTDVDGKTQFEYRGWNVDIGPPMVGEMCSLRADLYYLGEHKCRLTLSSAVDPACAYWALDSKARNFIDEWATRPREVDGTASEEL